MLEKLTRPVVLLHLEGAVLLAVALWIYGWLDGNWWLFVLLILAPDLSAIGYVHSKTLGSVTYNLGHIYLGPVVLMSIGFFTNTMWAVHLGLIWLAHIGMDRAVGYGLKYATDFKDTHLKRV